MGRKRYCSYCFDEGHNRRTCESFTAYYKSAAEGIRDRGKTSINRFAELYTKRTGLDLDGNFVGKPKQERRASVRQCSWCRGRYHNKRTCPKRAEWMEGKNKENEKYRYAIQERAKALAIGVGSLLSTRRYFWATDDKGELHYNAHQILGLIEKIDWDAITCDNASYEKAITVHWVNCPTDDVKSSNGMGRREEHQILASLLRPDHQFKGWDVDVVGHSDSPTAGMPNGWTTKKAKFEEPEMGTHWY
jgi:hypothetical protein